MEPLFKAGEYVTVKSKRPGASNDYRFSFPTDMIDDVGGERFEIVRVSKVGEPNDYRVKDDGYMYKLRGAHYTFASSMFEESDSKRCILELNVDESDSDIEPFIRKRKAVKFNFNL